MIESYRDVQEVVRSPDSEWRYIDSKQTHACLSQIDVYLREVPDEDRDPWEEDWVKSYSDPKGYRVQVEVYCRSSILEDLTFVMVDGGRHLIPLPKRDMTITPWQYAVGSIVNMPLGSPSEFDGALERAGIKVSTAV